MPGTNLTRDEARDRAALLDIESYTVDLDLDPARTTTFGSTTVIRFRSRQGASTFADLVGATIHEVTLNGRSLDPAAVYADHRIRLDDLAEDNELRVVADCAYSHTGEGLHRFVDPADDRVYLYSQMEVPDARRVFTTFEQPDLKSVFHFTVTAPAHWVVVSNAPTPEPQPAGDERSVWRFPATERMSTYVTAIVAGEYHQVHDTYVGKHGEIPMGHYCRQSMVPYFDTDELVEVTKQGFAFFEDAFDYPYPFHKYDQLYVPEFNNGAMENAGCVTLRDEYLPRSRQATWFYEQRANTVLHEMAHMWFGDLVTMRWWDDLWLNESFAEWASHHALVEATKYDEAWTGFTNARKNWAYRQDQLPSTHPIAADNHDLEAVEVSFDGITYAKGASALKQLVAWVGEQESFAGLKAYFRRHAFGNSEFQDLLSALEETSGRDLQPWAEEWLQTSGVNTLAVDATVDEDGRYSSFAVVQSAHPDHPTLRRHRIGVGLYDRAEDGRLVRRTTVETDVVGARTEVTKLVGTTQPDLVLLNDGDLSYAKIRFDERSLATVRESIHRIESSLARALCWGALWDMTRDAELSAGDFVALVLQGLPAETDETAVKQLPVYVQIAIDQFSHPAKRDALRATWEKGLRELIEDAEPGSDHQLTFVKSFAGTSGKRVPPSSYGGAARSEEGLDLVAALLDGSVRLEGLEVAPDLRWALVTALARGGRADVDRVAEELARDNTISGQERAAAARAVIPSAETKAQAWADAALSNEVSNETMRSIAYVFDASEQADVLEPYLEKYLAVADTIWEDQGTQIASTMLEYMFPRALTSRATLDRVDAWLATSQANPAAQRLVGEARADIARALAAQDADA
ncbi:aminopeptidase N [Nocardioides panacis]|uniref:Aminopeptidase N n=1 Tax=Nocardioides panacis TaxID=2849501 RepID=A0A975XYP6_9ACTN|nr:aminopeptidase N [Nocardioides panacis]QWZ06606.1 aminopeptidase N [Nocardioides panacis]